MIGAILKFAGGKGRHLGAIIPLLPGGKKCRFVEPFCGSAIVSANYPGHSRWLNDTNKRLVDLYKSAMLDPDGLIARCEEAWSKYGNTENGYRAARADFNAAPDGESWRNNRSALLVYLNRHCFNSLYRTNLKGEFNVPFGRYAKVNIPTQAIFDYHHVFSCGDTEITSLDFEKVIDQCGEGDMMYIDPPFAPVSKTANFTAYGPHWMGEVDLVRLDAALHRATRRGAIAVASASDTEMSTRAHSHADVAFKVEAHRSISCKADGRVPTGELLFVYKGGK